MKKFVITYNIPPKTLELTKNTTPEEASEGMERWHKWADKCGDHLLDLGLPLSNGKVVSSSGNISDSSSYIGGYSILQATNMEEAIKLVQGHPHLSWNDTCTIELYECGDLPE